MLLDSQGQPQGLLSKDQKFISFFFHGHLFQLKCAAWCLRAPLCCMDKMVRAIQIRIFCAKFEEPENALMIYVTRLSLILLQQFIEVVIFCVLLYLYKRRNVKHIVIVMLLVALLGMHTWKVPDWG